MRNENFIIIDMEAIKTVEEHSGIRKLHILSKDGMKDLEVDHVAVCYPGNINNRFLL